MVFSFFDIIVAITAVVGAVLGLYNLYKDRPHLALNMFCGGKIYGDNENQYMIITISNNGRRPVFIKDVFLEYEGKKVEIGFHDVIKLTDHDRPLEYYQKHSIIIDYFKIDTVDVLKQKLKIKLIDCRNTIYEAECSCSYAYNKGILEPLPFNSKPRD